MRDGAPTAFERLGDRRHVTVDRACARPNSTDILVSFWVLNRPAAGDIRNERGRLIQNRRAAHFPNRDIAGPLIPTGDEIGDV